MAVEESVLYFDGKYNPDRRFVIHNWTEEDVHSFWDGRPIHIKAGEMYECDHAIARKLTKEIVDREMFKEAERAYYSAGDNKLMGDKLRERGEMAILSRDKRKPLEDKTITEIKAGEENPIVTRIRAEERAKLEAERTVLISNEKAVDNTVTSTSTTEVELTYTTNATTGEEVLAEAKEIAPKRGRKPKGEFEE